MNYHSPVLLKESIDALAIKEDGVYVDVTFGGGGHSREILSRLGENGRLFGFDQDPDALENVIDDARFTLIPENFRYISRFLRFNGVKKVDGVLADLGVSSHQFDEGERGFSTRFDGDLDMRMNQKSKISAKEVISSYSEEKLAEILFLYGDLRNSRNIAKTIVEKRQEEKIERSTIRMLLDELKFDWQEKTMNLVQTASGFRFEALPSFSEALMRLNPDRVMKYSRMVMEVLSIIAYRQPVTRGDIEKIRGVSLNPNALRQVIEREWIEIIGQKEVPGRPSLYATTKYFLDDFGLLSITELPDINQFTNENSSGEPIQDNIDSKQGRLNEYIPKK